MKNRIYLFITIISLSIVCFIFYYYNHQTDDITKKIFNDSRKQDLNIIDDEKNYECSVFNNTDIKSPTGILFNENKIFITDSAQNCVFIFDDMGNIKNKIGSTGHGKMQFLSPHQIVFFNEEYYVLDSGNSRIQIFNKEFEYLDTIELNKFYEIDVGETADFSYSDLCIDKNGNIYVSTLSISPKNTHIYKIDSNKIVHQIGNNLVGFLSVIDEEPYFVNHKKVFSGKLNGKNQNFYISYENYLYKIDNTVLKELGQLPFKYDPVGFTSNDENIFMVSRSRNTLDKFSKDGEYISTLFNFEPNSKIRYLLYIDELNCFIATSPENGKVYKIYEEI